jgi:MFS family permease
MSAIPGPDPLYRRTVWRLLLPIAVLTFINAIDRMNVSFAGQPMSQSAGLSPTTFGLGVSTFFVAYLIFQYPHALPPRRWGAAVAAVDDGVGRRRHHDVRARRMTS